MIPTELAFNGCSASTLLDFNLYMPLHLPTSYVYTIQETHKWGVLFIDSTQNTFVPIWIMKRKQIVAQEIQNQTKEEIWPGNNFRGVLVQ